MEPKNRLLIAITVIILIVIAMFTSFGRILFALNTPSVVLPNIDSLEQNGSSSSSQTSPEQYQAVEVNPQTVGSVIQTLTRKDSYYREISVTTYWEGGSSSIPVQTWVDSGWSHSRQVLPSGTVRHDLVGNDILYYWYEGSSIWESAPADTLSSDLTQRIPTYETVIDLDPDEITDAGYHLKEGIPCVYAEVVRDDPLYRERYWVSVDNGLLICAELEKEGTLVYQMTAYGALISPCPADVSFALPNGAILHTT